MEVRARPEGGYTVHAKVDGTERVFTADGVVCATTATQVPLLFGDLTDKQREFFAGIRYSTTISVAVPTCAEALRPFTGILMPRRETSNLAAVTVRSANGTLPGNAQDVLLLFASSDGARRLSLAGPDEITQTLVADLRAAVPSFAADIAQDRATVQRWPEALPVFDVGHLCRLREFAEGRYETGSIVFAGDYIGGPFVEGAVSSGLAAADRLLTRMRKG